MNEEAVHRIVGQYGFEIYEPGRSADTVRDFAEAAMVVGPHGGGLTDLAFCAPGTKVVELVPTDHDYPYYYSLAEAGGLDYSCLVCKSEHERPKDTWGPSTFDFHVDERALIEALEALVGECT